MATVGYHKPNPEEGQTFGYFAADLMAEGLKGAGKNPTWGSFITNLRAVKNYDAHGGLARLVLVIPGVESRLLLHGRVALFSVLTLVGRHGRGAWYVGAIHVVPAAVRLRPGGPPVLCPAGRRIRCPAMKIAGWPTVVSDRNLEDEGGYDVRIDERPRAVVPGAAVPVVVLVDPVHAVVEEEVAVDARRIVDGRAGDERQCG